MLTLISIITIYKYSTEINKLFGEQCDHMYMAHHEPSGQKAVTIVMWTKYFGKDIFPSHDFHKCSDQCFITSSRCVLSEADALAFHWRDLSLFDLPEKSNHQKWIIYNQESPEHISLGAKLMLKYLENAFDWTLTYRQDSDIVAPYGKVFPRLSSNISTNQIDFSSKRKSVAWLVSNCRTESRREDYVEELRKYIDVDIIGECGSQSCSRTNRSSCYHMFEQQYFFYLSFENSICKDYATEKIFHVLKYDIIPVTFGGADYKSILPPKSFVNAMDFASPRQLATFLTNLASDEKEYKSYFNWRKKFFVKSDYNDLCLACDKLLKAKLEPKPEVRTPTRDIFSWWFDSGNCSSWELRS